MKNNLKSLQLVEKGMSPETVSKLSESQINVLHSKLISEQVKQEKKVMTKTTIPTNTLRTTGANVDGVSIKMDPSGNVVASQVEGELGESGKEPKKNPWAICHAKLGPRKNAKFESCVKQVKKSLKEEKNEVTSFLENKIVDLLEKYLPPKITKGDLIKYLVEDKPAVAPKPGTKEPKPDTKNPPKIKPSHPGRNPNPKVNPAPKAKRNEISPEVAKDEVLDLIKNILEK
jgi:hypothetical protein